jgi:hypothetical protein
MHMHCVGDTCWCFRVVARPDPAADRVEAVAELRHAVAEHGAGPVEVDRSDRTEFTFELAAASPEAACELVTVIFQSVYGLNWQAEISPVRLGPTRFAPPSDAAWN